MKKRAESDARNEQEELPGLRERASGIGDAMAALPPGWHLVVLLASLLTLGILIVTVSVPIRKEVLVLLIWADTAVCGVFFVDFILMLRKSRNKLRYFMTWGWVDLISSVPLLHHARWLVAARVVRIFRLIRGWQSGAYLVQTLTGKIRQTTGFAIGMMTILLMVFASTAILIAEIDARGSVINTPGEAIWWTVVTMTTTGYGDLVPVTDLGKVVAGVTMILGLLLIGTFTALVASSLVATEGELEKAQLESLRQELDALRQSVQEENDKKV